MLKTFHALNANIRRKDNTPLEKLEYNRVRATLESLCDEYLKNSSDILVFESLPSAIDATLAVLESKRFLEEFEFGQESETIFQIRKKDLDLF